MATKKKPARKAKAVKTAKAARRRPKRKKPETLRLRTSSPTYTVNDIDKSLRWYCDVLGFVAGERWEEGGKLLGGEVIAGDVTFYLMQDDWKKGRDRVKGEGFRVHCTTAQDVDVLAGQVKARGARIDREPNDEMGYRNFSLLDPDGYRITLQAVRKR